jgi:hypothetical protein
MISSKILKRLHARRSLLINKLAASCCSSWRRRYGYANDGCLPLPAPLLVYIGLVHFPILTQNIFSSTYHIKSFDACMEH